MARTRMLLDLLAHGRTHRYGSDRSQRADLYLPAPRRRALQNGPHPVMVLIHGGSWRKRYGRIVMRALAGDLLRRGWAVWNIEYRRVGNGGGWPATFEDVAAAIDHLDRLDAPLDLTRVSMLGHSAGGHLALWAAGREAAARRARRGAIDRPAARAASGASYPRPACATCGAHIATGMVVRCGP